MAKNPMIQSLTTEDILQLVRARALSEDTLKTLASVKEEVRDYILALTNQKEKLAILTECADPKSNLSKFFQVNRGYNIRKAPEGFNVLQTLLAEYRKMLDYEATQRRRINAPYVLEAIRKDLFMSDAITKKPHGWDEIALMPNFNKEELLAYKEAIRDYILSIENTDEKIGILHECCSPETPLGKYFRANRGLGLWDASKHNGVLASLVAELRKFESNGPINF